MFESIVRGIATLLFLVSALFLALTAAFCGALAGAVSGAASWYILDRILPDVLNLAGAGPTQFFNGGGLAGIVATLFLTLRCLVQSGMESKDASLRALATRVNAFWHKYLRLR